MRLRLQMAIAALGLTLSGTLAGLAPSSAAVTGAALTTVDNPGGGHIATGSLGKQPSLQAAAVAMLGRIHHLMGERPTVVRVAQNTSAHSVMLFFTGTWSGLQYTGMSLISAAPGSEASGAVLYDTTARFPTTIKPMLQRFGTMKMPARQNAASGTPLAPAEPLITHQFSDGSGSMGVPADWTFKSGGGGSAFAGGPTGKEVVSYNFTQPAVDPSSRFGQDLARGTGIFATVPMRQHALQTTALLPYTGDPVKAWMTSFNVMAQQKSGKAGPSFRVNTLTRTGPNSAFIGGTGTNNGPVTYFAYVSVSPPDRMGQWMMYYSFVVLPTNEVAKEGATAAAVLNSVHIDYAVLNSHFAQMEETFQKQFEAQIASDQQQDALREQGTERAMARDSANSDAMHRTAVGFEHYIAGTSVISVNGLHAVPIDSNLAAALVEENPHFHIVSPSEFIKGVDY